MISNPILHDIIKSELDHNKEEILSICKHIPCLSQSNLIKNPVRKNLVSIQEHQYNSKQRYNIKFDCLWVFTNEDIKTTPINEIVDRGFKVIHEVKTGNYDLDEITNKYYTGMSSQIWIWGWREKHLKNLPLGDPITFGHKKLREGQIKLLNIENLVPIITRDINTIHTRLVS